jgi:phosphate transport system substrate-binding protein
MRRVAGVALAILIMGALSCSKGSQSGDEQSAAGTSLRGVIKVDGSSTVFPITEAVAEEFGREHPRVRVTVGISGTGGGFKKFGLGETDMSAASRPITPDETEHALAHGVSYIEIPVAFDGVSIVVNPKNHFVDLLTQAELQKIWAPDSIVTLWSDIRAEWPARKIRLYGPGTDSGTFDYFTHAIMGKAGSSRADFTASEDDNVIVQGVAGDVDALGYFGFAYYAENIARLKIVPIAAQDRAVVPSDATIANGTYPLARPIFIYINSKSAVRPEMTVFLKFYLDNASVLVKEVGYTPLPPDIYPLAWSRIRAGKLGTVFASEGGAHKSLAELLAK